LASSKINIGGEAELILSAQRGDAAAVRSLYDGNGQYLPAVCSRYINSSDDMKDVLQEALIKIFSSLGTFSYRGPGSLQGWMKRIVVNESLMFLRRERSSELVFSDEKLPDLPLPKEADPDGIPVQELHKMISELPAGYRSVLNLYIFEEKSHREIAGMLGISENTSFSQYHKAKAMLAKKIIEYRNGQ